MGRGSKKAAIYLLNLVFFFSFWIPDGLSQPGTKEEISPRVRLENVTFRVREIESTPSPLRILEVYVEIFNPSPQEDIPPNSIKAVVTPKKVNHSGETLSDDPVLPPGEVTLNLPLPSRTRQTLVIGFSLPKHKLESITFEVHLNPPEGETKVVTWEEK